MGPLRSKLLNRSLHTAEATKQAEYHTPYVDIQKQHEAYLEFDPETFRDSAVSWNCDDPFASNSFKHFAASFKKLGFTKLICTSYDGSPIAGQLTLFPKYHQGHGRRKKPTAVTVTLDRVRDEHRDGAASITDVKLFLKGNNKVARVVLKGSDRYPGGDFRSDRVLRRSSP